MVRKILATFKLSPQNVIMTRVWMGISKSVEIPQSLSTFSHCSLNMSNIRSNMAQHRDLPHSVSNDKWKIISMISFAINESIWSRQHFSEGIIWSKSVDKPPGTIAKLPLPHTKTLATLGEYYHQNYTCAYISHHVLHTYHVLVREKLQLPDPDWSTEPDDYLLGIKTVPGYSMCVCECMCVHVWLHGHD